jgi:hypothetical protein
VTAKNNDDPFSNWPDLIDKAVYSIDGKNLGFLRKIHSDYLVIGGGIIILKKYFIPKSLAESVSRRGIRLIITACEARSKYSYAKMKSLVTIFKFMPEYAVEDRAFYDRVHTLRYHVTRNRLAAAANKVNIAKFSLWIGTGQGLFTIAFHILSEITSSSSGRVTFGNHYVIWLTSSMAGIGILFAVIAQSISKGRGDSIISKVLGFLGVRKLLLILKKKM